MNLTVICFIVLRQKSPQDSVDHSCQAPPVG